VSRNVEFRENLLSNSRNFIKDVNEYQPLLSTLLEKFNDCIYLQRTLHVMRETKENGFSESRSLMNGINEILLVCLYFWLDLEKQDDQSYTPPTYTSLHGFHRLSFIFILYK
jgi:hypothetical protein